MQSLFWKFGQHMKCGLNAESNSLIWICLSAASVEQVGDVSCHIHIDTKWTDINQCYIIMISL